MNRYGRFDLTGLEDRVAQAMGVSRRCLGCCSECTARQVAQCFLVGGRLGLLSLGSEGAIHAYGILRKERGGGPEGNM